VQLKINTKIAPELILSSKKQKITIFFFYLKSKYENSVFYNYTPKKLSTITGISENTVRKYISWLKRNDYLAITNKNLWLKSTRKISPGEKYISIDTRPWTTWKQFENRVYAALIKRNIKQQSYHYRMKEFLAGGTKKKMNVRNVVNYQKRYGQYAKESAGTPVYNSERQIARLFSKSKTWAHNRLKTLVKMGYIEISQLIETLPFRTNPEFLPEYKPGRCFLTKRGVTIHHGIKISVKY
jgi:predicted HTH transcriptional regulator